MSANHGNTPAAWTAVTIIFVGFVVGGVAFPMGSMPLVVVGAVLVVVGGIVGKVMQMMGMGQKRYSTVSD